MATIKGVRSWPNGEPPNELWTWANLLTASADGGAVKSAAHMDLTWQVVVANAGGATLSLQGSNDGTNWFTLKKADSNAAEFTAAGGCVTLERPVYVRPNLTVGGTAADFTVTCHMAKKG